MKLFAVTKTGRKGEWIDDCPRFHLQKASHYMLPHYPDYRVHLHAGLYDSNEVQPEDFGEDAVIFCTGKVNGVWKWHILLSPNGVQRGLEQGWLGIRGEAPKPVVEPYIPPAPTMWGTMVAFFGA
ncbi:hypothetical protein D3C75_224090 [compost metagenome]